MASALAILHQRRSAVCPKADTRVAASVPLLTDVHKSARTCESASMRKIKRISISAADRERLKRLVQDRNTPQKVVSRARIVLLANDGLTAEGLHRQWGNSRSRSAGGAAAMWRMGLTGC